jgi:lipopolysaccharide/colanic/teichoic acid biosynthesis glycosyltransferase
VKSRNKKIRLLIGDTILIIISYVIVLLWKSGSFSTYLIQERYFEAFIVFTLTAIITSALFGKYAIIGKTRFFDIVMPIVKSNLMIMGLVSILIYIFQLFYYSRLMVFGTIYILSIFELIGVVFYYYIQKSFKGNVFEEDGKVIKVRFNDSDKKSAAVILTETPEIVYSEDEIIELERSFRILNKNNKDLIIEESGEKAYSFITRFIDINGPGCGIFSTTSKFNIDKQPDNYLKSVVNLHRINDIRRINKFFESVNRKLTLDGVFICCVETKNMRKKRIFKKFVWGFSHIYYLIDFFYKRVWPKLPGLNKIYFFMSSGINRVLSKQEAMGRLYSCGFRLVSEAVVDNLQYFVAVKVKKPVYDEQPSYGPIFRMRRVGKEGKIIYVYKFRTMYPYSEYLQEYIYERHKLDTGGKFDKDIRVTTLGRIFRRFWLDELPMIVNWMRGDLKLVGVRPISEHYLSLYSDELKQLRFHQKPGLFPPFYADMPKNLEEIMASEIKYLKSYKRSPFFTDIKYFFKVSFNIIFRKARSK